MTRHLAAWAAIVIVLMLLDLIWLGLIAKSIYRTGIGHLMADQARVGAALAFYVIFAAGLMFFAVMPTASEPGWGITALTAAVFGFVAYATYDLSNLATLREWPLSLALIDMAWGTLISCIAAVAGKLAMAQFPVS